MLSETWDQVKKRKKDIFIGMTIGGLAGFILPQLGFGFSILDTGSGILQVVKDIAIDNKMRIVFTVIGGFVGYLYEDLRGLII